MNTAIAVQEKPPLFSGAMVRAILEGRKTQTRRVVKQKHLPFIKNILRGLLDGKWNQRPLPYGKPGDRLWVRETHYRWGKWVKSGFTAKGRQRWRFSVKAIGGLQSEVRYIDQTFPEWSSAKKRTELGWHKRPAIFMPRWASRLTLEIVSVKVERVQEISEADAIAEGVERNCPNWNDAEKIKQCPACAPSGVCQSRDEFIHDGLGECDFPVTAKEAYQYLWDSINSKRGFGWEENPWVWAIEFRFTLVVALAFLGIVFHGLKPKKRRELPEDHWI